MKFCPQCGGTYEGAAGFCPDDGTVLEAAPAIQVGQLLDGQYEIEAFIARGGMGTLHRARHILLGDRVVIKMLRPEMRSNTEWLRRFQREGQAARRFRHPNAVIVYDLRASADGLTYMVMEYVEGHTLDKELKQRGRFTPAEALEVLEPVARALDVAHAHGVVHRDLKPENVMLSRDPKGRLQVKLLDLGIAKLRGVADVNSGDGGLTVAGQILGTPYYMSPEQWGARQRDGQEDIDGRTDIYSLGVIFYELCAGHKPFIAASLPEMQQAHLMQEPQPLQEVAPDVPAAFGNAIARALAKDRNDRQESVGDLADELRTALELTIEPNSASQLANSLNVQGTGSQFASSITAPRPAPVAPPSPAPSRAGDTGASHASRDAHTINTNAGDVGTRPGASIPTNTAPVIPAQTTGAKAAPNAWSAPAAPVASAAGVESAAASTPAAAGVGAQGQTRSTGPLVAGIAALVLLACVAAGGWFVWQRAQAKRTPVESPVSNVNTDPARPTNAPAPVEALTYWLEAYESGREQTGQRVAAAGALSLRSGQQFKFHFTPRTRGYLYIIGPGPQGNAPTTFLTARPVGVMKTNQAAAGADFSFPYGPGVALQLDRNPGTEEYMVIFAPTPLLTPGFLTAPAGHELTPAEQAELEQLRAQAQTAASIALVQQAQGAQPAVAVNVPATEQTARPVVFDIRIEHK
ncbi:MAG TPA: protein kinase [Pyrinomonadaceae bacterium]|jgi:serine/threonine-protein kinase